jgi:hypothetical protein
MGGNRLFILHRGTAAKEFFTMKNKLSIVLVVLLVLGLFFTACSSDDDSSDPIKGTWVNTDVDAIISAANGTFKQFSSSVEVVRGTYTYSGNVVTVKMTEVNPIIFGRTGAWIKYSDLSSAEKASLGYNTDTFMLTINGNTFSTMGLTFTKQ